MHTHTHRTIVDNLYCCGKVKEIDYRRCVDDRRVFHISLFIAYGMARVLSRCNGKCRCVVGFGPCTRRWGTNAALDMRHGSSLQVLVLTWGRMGVRADGGPGKDQDARYFPKSVPPRCDATCIRRILALSPVASQVSTAPDACRPASRAATLLSPRLACVTQASPISRRVVLGQSCREEVKHQGGAISLLLDLGWLTVSRFQVLCIVLHRILLVMHVYA